MDSSESCQVCGGDGRVGNAFGGDTARCPGCKGTGRRSYEPLYHDVTKTKPSHYRSTNKVDTPVKRDTPTTATGVELAREVQESGLPEATRTRLVREIIDYEDSHGLCTKTFTRKLSKQIKA